MGQFYPGVASEKSMETPQMRHGWFVSALMKIQDIPDLESVAFPYKIGCGLAGGNWEFYRSCIDTLAEATPAKVSIYKLESEPW
jgi:hypothetical protein